MRDVKKNPNKSIIQTNIAPCCIETIVCRNITDSSLQSALKLIMQVKSLIKISKSQKLSLEVFLVLTMTNIHQYYFIKSFHVDQTTLRKLLSVMMWAPLSGCGNWVRTLIDMTLLSVSRLLVHSLFSEFHVLHYL